VTSEYKKQLRTSNNISINNLKLQITPKLSTKTQMKAQSCRNMQLSKLITPDNETKLSTKIISFIISIQA